MQPTHYLQLEDGFWLELRKSNGLSSTCPRRATHFVFRAKAASAVTVSAVTATASSTTSASYVAHATPTSKASHAVKANRLIKFHGCDLLHEAAKRTSNQAM